MKIKLILLVLFSLAPLLVSAHGNAPPTIHDDLDNTIDYSLVHNAEKNCDVLTDKDYSEIGAVLLGEMITPETIEAAKKVLRPVEIDRLNIISGILGTGCFSAKNWETLKDRIPGTIVAGSGKGKLIGAIILGLLAGIILGKVIGGKKEA